MMMAHVEHLNPPTLNQNPMFTQAVVVSGAARTVYIGGQNGVDSTGAIVDAGDLAAQVEQVFENLSTVLAAAGGKLQDIVKWTIYVVAGHDIRPSLAIFARRWGNSSPPPAITVVTVASMANPDFLVEIEAVAVVRGEASDAD